MLSASRRGRPSSQVRHGSLSLKEWWTAGGGGDWLESFLELPRLGPVDSLKPHVVVQADARKTLDLDLRVPVAVMTGWYLADDHEPLSMALGAAAFIRKPLVGDDIVCTLRSIIHISRAMPAASVKASVNRSGPAAAVAGGRARARREEDATLLALHASAINGDAHALDKLCERILPELEYSVSLKARRAERDWVHDAVQEAVLEFRASPRRFDRTRGVSLTAFLWVAAYRNLLNRMDRERRRTWHTVSIADGTLEAVAPSVVPDYDRDLDLQKALLAVWRGLSNAERRVFQLLRQGEQRADVLAQAAGAPDLKIPEQRLVVKRIANRIFQRMRRLRRGPKRLR